MSKIKTFHEIKEICRTLKQRKKEIVFTNGCFDIIHAGHVRMLKEASLQGDILIVGLNSDTSVKRIKGKNRPYVTESDRAEILEALEMVDYIVIFSDDTPEKLLSVVKPDVLVKGGDYTENQIIGRHFVESYGGRVIVVPRFKNLSTTGIVNRILSS